MHIHIIGNKRQTVKNRRKSGQFIGQKSPLAIESARRCGWQRTPSPARFWPTASPKPGRRGDAAPAATGITRGFGFRVSGFGFAQGPPGPGAASELHRNCIGAPPELHRSCIGAASELHRSCIGAASELHRSCIGAASELHRNSIRTPSELHRGAIGSPRSADAPHWPRKSVQWSSGSVEHLQWWNRCSAPVGTGALDRLSIGSR